MICVGQAGHGSLMQENSTGEKVQFMINKFMEFRKNEMDKLKNNPNLKMGDVTAVNLTMIEGGTQTNVVPPEMRVTFDIRVAIDVDHDAFDRQVWRTLDLDLNNIFIVIVISTDRKMVRRSWWRNHRQLFKERAQSANHSN